MCIALVIQHAMRLLRTVICGLHRCTIFFSHYLINDTIFEKEKFLCTKWLCWFSLQSLSGTFLIFRRTERDMIKSVYWSHVKYPLFLSDFNETWIFLTDFRKILRYQISWKSVQWDPSCSNADRRTDMKKLIVTFHIRKRLIKLSIFNPKPNIRCSILNLSQVS